jgi:WD40 repeat protein
VWSGDEKGEVSVWSASTGAALRYFTARPGAPALLAAAGRSGFVLCAGSGPGAVDVWSAGEAMIVATVVLPCGDTAIAALGSSDSSGSVVWIAAGADVFSYDHVMQTVRCARAGEKLSTITSLACSGTLRFWTGHSAGEVCLWELDRDGVSAQVFFHRKAHSGPVGSLAWAPPSSLWTCSSGTAEVSLIEWRGLLCPWRAITIAGYAAAELVCSAADGGHVAIESNDGVVAIFRILDSPLRSVAPPSPARLSEPAAIPNVSPIRAMSASFVVVAAASSSPLSGSPMPRPPFSTTDSPRHSFTATTTPLRR